MTSRATARTTSRRIFKILAAGLLLATAAIAAPLGYQSLTSSPSTAASPTPGVGSQHDGAPASPTVSLRSEHRAPPSPLGMLRSDRGGELGVAGGAVPRGTTVFDDDVPAVARLDAGLLGALRRAATDAKSDGLEFFVNSGWRSREYQEHLLDEAVSKYGSRAEAARWVATPSTSAHVSGEAADIGHSASAAWLSKHGAEYGLCQVYRNEPWHYELRPEAVDQGCPVMYADPTQDPRMQQ